jgi:hypothetical protein
MVNWKGMRKRKENFSEDIWCLRQLIQCHEFEAHMTSAYKISVIKMEEKRLLVRCRRRGEDNSKMGLKVIGCEVVDSIHL